MREMQFNRKEEIFIQRIMKPFEEITSKKPELYHDFLEKVMSEQLKGMLTSDARELIDGILFKIVMRRADMELEKVLTDPDYAEVAVENTKAASYGKIRNLTEKHEQILQVITKYPGICRRDLAQILNWPINRVTPRVRELIDSQRIVVSGTKWDFTTERCVESLKVV